MGRQSEIERGIGDLPDADRTADPDRILRAASRRTDAANQNAVAKESDVGARVVEPDAEIVERQ